jgi:hypothetical protein
MVSVDKRLSTLDWMMMTQNVFRTKKTENNDLFLMFRRSSYQSSNISITFKQNL